MDVSDAQPPRFKRTARPVRKPSKQDGAGVRLNGGREKIHEGALTGAVLSYDGMDFSVADLQIHTFQGDRGAEMLGYTLDL
jgi:hypothetical protein